MKKLLMTALLISAIPAVAVGQTVSCEACTHEVSYYMGEGGFIATAGEDAEMVTYVSSCGGVTRSGELAPNDDGMVSMLFSMDNGLACHSTATDDDGVTKNRLQIGPVMDGGWYWITDDMNSAVGNLVAQDVLDVKAVDLTSAGAGVSMAMGKGAVFVKEAATGRVGILPNILPEPPVAALRKCGYTGAFTATSPGVPLKTECALGDAGTITLATVHNSFTGATTRVMDKGTVMRPTGATATVVVTVDLWGNGSGHFVTTHDATTGNGISAGLGQPALGLVAAARANTRLTGTTFTAKLGSGPTAADLVDATAAGGITMDTSTTPNVVTFTIGADSAYCSKTNNNPAPVAVAASITEAGAALVTPSIKRNATTGAAGATSFTVVCGSASSSAHQGQELVPENPFPTDR